MGDRIEQAGCAGCDSTISRPGRHARLASALLARAEADLATLALGLSRLRTALAELEKTALTAELERRATDRLIECLPEPDRTFAAKWLGP